MKLLNLVKTLFDLILPPRCPITGEMVPESGTVSPAAWQGISFITNPLCSCCGIPFEIEAYGEGLCGPCIAQPRTYRSARSALVYDESSRKLILSFKHGDQTHMVPAFLPWLSQAGQAMLEPDTVLIPVPLHWSRLLKRRYNQAALLAHALQKKHALTHWPDALVRTRRTPSQGHLSASERSKNVRKAFEINKKYAASIKQKNVVLIDDVYTTGATVEECAAVLYEARAANVDILTLSRVVRPEAVN